MVKKIKDVQRKDNGYTVSSIWMRNELLEKLDSLATKTGRSRNDIINLLLESAVDIVKIEE